MPRINKDFNKSLRKIQTFQQEQMSKEFEEIHRIGNTKGKNKCKSYQ